MTGSSDPSTSSPAPWTPDSWRTKPIKQCPEYPDKAALKRSVDDLKRLPPIVHPREIEKLKEHLRDVARGDAFLLQGGDCAELFSYCEQNAIESKIKLLLQMSLVLIWGADKRVVRIGRMAGQYAKPRSSPTEVVDGKEVPSFRGDILNGFPLDERELDPGRLVKCVMGNPGSLPLAETTKEHSHFALGRTTTRRPRSTTSEPPSRRASPTCTVLSTGGSATCATRCSRPSTRRRSSSSRTCSASCTPSAPTRATSWTRSTSTPATRACSSSTRRA
ncbi:hypothetical protein VTK73DRAFT_5639 [Phialemonium thermophilum]|uniref:Phospho-2-dehydro-3-deoxyheptonate aldolase n=1 Tax=Phialemonium thermophilum TaxID=223376 RepID=A0ABR3V0X7_9PEZI